MRRSGYGKVLLAFIATGVLVWSLPAWTAPEPEGTAN